MSTLMSTIWVLFRLKTWVLSIFKCYFKYYEYYRVILSKMMSTYMSTLMSTIWVLFWVKTWVLSVLRVILSIIGKYEYYGVI